MNKLELNNDHFGEVLNILQEEAAEIIQSSSKVKRFGLDSTYGSKVSNRESLEEEIGDFLCIVKILTANGILDMGNIEKSINAKEQKLADWSPTLTQYLKNV
jgi:NTP pyrophosphatase (non-canonical NTP hydrolase)